MKQEEHKKKSDGDFKRSLLSDLLTGVHGGDDDDDSDEDDGDFIPHDDDDSDRGEGSNDGDDDDAPFNVKSAIEEVIQLGKKSTSGESKRNSRGKGKGKAPVSRGKESRSSEVQQSKESDSWFNVASDEEDPFALPPEYREQQRLQREQQRMDKMAVDDGDDDDDDDDDNDGDFMPEEDEDVDSGDDDDDDEEEDSGGEDDDEDGMEHLEPENMETIMMLYQDLTKDPQKVFQGKVGGASSSSSSSAAAVAADIGVSSSSSSSVAVVASSSGSSTDARPVAVGLKVIGDSVPSALDSGIDEVASSSSSSSGASSANIMEHSTSSQSSKMQAPDLESDVDRKGDREAEAEALSENHKQQGSTPPNEIIVSEVDTSATDKKSTTEQPTASPITKKATKVADDVDKLFQEMLEDDENTLKKIVSAARSPYSASSLAEAASRAAANASLALQGTLPRAQDSKQQENSHPKSPSTPGADSSSPLTPPGNVSETAPKLKRKVTMDDVIERLQKRQKSSLQHSSQVWKKFKSKEGIEEELKQYTKDGYLEKQAFLQRTEMREFEQAKALRNRERERQRWASK